jgi:hypothetical protein
VGSSLVVLSEGMREGPIISWRAFVMGRPWFEVLVVFGVGELKVFAGESPDVVDVRPPAEGDDSVWPRPDPE